MTNIPEGFMETPLPPPDELPPEFVELSGTLKSMDRTNSPEKIAAIQFNLRCNLAILAIRRPTLEAFKLTLEFKEAKANLISVVGGDLAELIIDNWIEGSDVFFAK